MIAINVLSQRPISDGFQVLCKVRPWTADPPPVSVLARVVSRVFVLSSKNRTEPFLPNSEHEQQVSSRLMPNPRSLRLVVFRKPIPYRPYEHVPDYLLAYVIETLECGHSLTIYPGEHEPLIAKRRACPECSGYYGALPLTPKKPVQSVSVAEERKRRKA